VSLSLRFAARSDVGLLRDLNEDAMYAGPRLLAIADGMGGHAAGEVASRIAIESVAPLDDESPGSDLVGTLRDAVETASGYLQDMVAADSALDGMGTTLTALLFAGQRLGLVHVGDSRCYLMRDGMLSQITHDHTLVQHLVDEGRITPEEASTHPQRSWITRSLTGHGELELDLSIREARIGDRYLLCSDGLSGPVSEDTIAEALRAAPDAQTACDQLVELALRAGGPDNVTAIVADVVDDDVEEEPIVGGSAADVIPPTSDGDTPAARAARIHHRRRAVSRDGDDRAAGAARPRRRRGRLAWVIGLIALVVIAGAVATYLFARTQYYVGTTGHPPVVAVYRGIGSLASVDARTDIPVSALPEYEQANLRDHIDAGNRNSAGAVVARLRAEACPSPIPAPAASPAATASAKPRASAPSAATPSPTPTNCHG
jgi:protein phosphatase